jgi:hypothetical protein
MSRKSFETVADMFMLARQLEEQAKRDIPEIAVQSQPSMDFISIYIDIPRSIDIALNDTHMLANALAEAIQDRMPEVLLAASEKIRSKAQERKASALEYLEEIKHQLIEADREVM